MPCADSFFNVVNDQGFGVWAKPLTPGNLAHGDSVSLQCRYRVARPCAEIVAMCTGVEGGVKGLKCRYVLEIPTSLALLCLVVIVEKNTHAHPFNGPFLGTTQVSRYQKRKTNLDFTEARDSEWQWHLLCKFAPRSSQIYNASTPPLSFHRPDAAQPTAS